MMNLAGFKLCDQVNELEQFFCSKRRRWSSVPIRSVTYSIRRLEEIRKVPRSSVGWGAEIVGALDEIKQGRNKIRAPFFNNRAPWSKQQLAPFFFD